MQISEKEHYADEIDRAAAISDAHNEDCVANARRAIEPEQVPDADGNFTHVDCIECGDELPTARLNLGRVRCVACQEIKERRGRMHVQR